MKNGSFLQKKRIYLRKIEKKDFENLFALFSDPDVMRFSIGGVCSREKVKEILQNMLDDIKERHFGIYVILDNKTDAWMGIVGVTKLGDQKLDLTCRLFPKYWKKGYGKEALLLFLNQNEKKLFPYKVYGYIEEENRASIKMAKSVGLIFEKKTTFHGISVLAFQWQPTHES